MSRVSKLAHLQSLDQELDEKTKRLKQIDDALSSDPIIASALEALAVEEKRLAGLRASLSLRELEGKTLDNKTSEIAERLYSGRVQNPKELEGIEKDLEIHRRQRANLDDQLLELMDSVEHAQAQANVKREELKTKQGSRANDVENLTQERDTLVTRLRNLAQTRDQERAAIDSDTLQTYDHLRISKAGRPVSPVRRDACSNCGVSVPTGLVQRIRLGEELVFCSGCGRILA